MGRRTTCLDPEQAHVGRDPAVETGLTKELPIDGLLSGPDSVVGPLEQSTDPTFRLRRPELPADRCPARLVVRLDHPAEHDRAQQQRALQAEERRGRVGGGPEEIPDRSVAAGLDRPAAVVEPAAGQTAIWLFERQ